MHNFPVPYPNELLYSTVARAGVYHGITSPKQLLDEVFSNRKVIATLDLPCHLQALANQLRNTGRYTIEELIHQHTLLPLYSPFVTEVQKIRAMQLMAGYSQGAVHLLLGVAASRVQCSDRLRYCRECLKSQYQQYGEYFWQRNWFFPGLSICPEHGALRLLSLGSGSHRHQFHALNPQWPVAYTKTTNNAELMRLAKFAAQLLTVAPGCSPSFAQWTIFYHNLAAGLGFCRGQHIKHDEIHEQVCKQFQPSTLAQLNLQTNPSKDTCWLKSIFRKHRKAFSYLEHGIVWQTFLAQRQPSEIIAQVRNIIPCTKVFFNEAKTSEVNSDNLLLKRQYWQQSVLKHGVITARKLGVGQALYSWLYRNDRLWLLKFNTEHKALRTNPQQKADWHQRDLVTVRQLRKSLPSSEDIYAGPRLSENHLLVQLHNKSTIEKNLAKLPLVSMFLERYTETVTEYQLRRLTNTCIALYRETGLLKKWIVLRKSGLSKERLTTDTQKVLSELHLF